MAITLAQARVISQDERQAAVLETFIQTSPILDRLPFRSLAGDTLRYNSEGTLPGVEFRAINAAYVESTGTFNEATESLVILGGDADVDTFIQATQGSLNDQVDAQVRLKVKALSYKFSDAFFNGDTVVDANSFNGLKKRITGGQVIAAGANGAPVVGNGGSDVQAFLDVLDSALAAARIAGPNGAIYANDLIAARLNSAGRRAGLVVDDIFDFEGITKRVSVYRGTPILDPGNKADGTRILPQTETQGTATDTSSVYCVRFGEDVGDGAVTGIYNGNHAEADQREGVFAVKRLGEQQAKPAHRIRVEGFVGLGVFGGNAAARITGVRNA